MLSLIVLAYNNWAYSRRCLESLAAARLPVETEVVFMDNASTDETATSALEYRDGFQRFVYARNPVNLTCSQALNRAASKASGASFLFLNNDVVVHPSAIVGLYDALHCDDSLGAVAPRLLFPDTGAIQHAGVVPMLWGHPVNDGAGASGHDPRFARDCEVFAVTGAMVLVRRSSFERVQGFDEGFVWGYEDVDLCLKMREAGQRILYVAIPGGTHHQTLTVRAQTPVLQANYHHYRRRWDYVLAPREQAYVEHLRSLGIREVLVFGTGQAARLVQHVLTKGGLTIVGFVDAGPSRTAEFRIADRPVWSAGDLNDVRFDALIVASQFYYAAEGHLPKGALFPIV